jgi:hypothetical protein
MAFFFKINCVFIRKLRKRCSSVVELLFVGIYDEKFSCGCLRSEVRGEPRVFFSSGNVASLCDSIFQGEVYVIIIFLYEKESN